MRARLHNFPQYVIQCALAPLGYVGPGIDEVQRVFLEIELAIRQKMDIGGVPAKNQWVEAAVAQQAGEVPAPLRYRPRGKQRAAAIPPPRPLLPSDDHPVDCVTYVPDKLSCSRCGRSVKRSHATNVRKFWGQQML